MLHPVGEALIQKLFYLLRVTSLWRTSCYVLMGTLQQAGHDGKTTSEGLVFSFTVWKQWTIQGSSISEKPHCLKWQSAQSCAAISPLSTTTLPDLMWPNRIGQLRDHPIVTPLPTSSCVLSLILLRQKFLAFPVLPSQEVRVFLHYTLCVNLRMRALVFWRYANVPLLSCLRK